jgi:GAF domain-containing protein
MRKDLDRLAELRRLSILESAPERAYDDITRAFAACLDVPIAMVNLLDAERDWFKSCIGLPQTESPAATSFCEAFFGSAQDLIVVEDTTSDARFASHPFVTGEPFIRFYAAARLVVRGHTVGTLCAYGVEPKKIAPAQVEQLHAMARAVTELLAQRARRPGTP